MSVIEFPSVPSWYVKYKDRGFKLIFYPARTKVPTDKDWPNREYKIEDYKDQNIGVLLGNEISPGRYLADVDFDWTPGIVLSPGILPRTKFGFGRPPTKPISHAFFTTTAPCVTKRYENIKYDPGDTVERSIGSQQCIVELRGVKENGSLGFQTMIPPSVHPSGEKLEFQIEQEIGHSEELSRRVLLYAITCILHAHIPFGTFKHEMRMACAGFLLTSNITTEEAKMIMKAIMKQDGPHDEGDETQAIDSTNRALNNKNKIVGKARFGELLGHYGPRVLSHITKWLGGTDFIENKGRIIPNQENIRRAIEMSNIHLSFDEFSSKAIIKYPGDNNGHAYHGEIEDNVRRRVWLELERKYHFLPPKQLCYDVMDDLSWEHRFHPVYDYLKPLVWDGISRISEWVIRSAGADDNEYVRAVSAIMLMAAVRRVMQPGCKYDEMVVFESGKQGLLKSSALRTLCPKDEWFSDNLPLNLKAQELIELTSGKWIIEVSELNKIKTTQMEHVKALLSRQDDTARLAYRHDAQTQRRQCIFIGTTNSYTYLTDQTGNRRFWPIRVGKFDIDWIRQNRDQLWAEAFVREQKGESIRLPEELYKPAEEQQENRLVDDDWKNILDAYFDKQYLRVAYDEIWEQLAIPVERRTPNVTQRVADVMQALGFSKASTVRNREGKVSKGWKRDEKFSPEEWRTMRGLDSADAPPEVLKDLGEM